jgi:hypothetical protein
MATIFIMKCVPTVGTHNDILLEGTLLYMPGPSPPSRTSIL